MKVIKTIITAIDQGNEKVGLLVSWVTVFMVMVIVVDVVMRYLFNISFVFVQELEWHLFSFIFLIGAGYTLLHDQHVRVDIFYMRLTAKGQAWVNLSGVILFLLPGCLLIIGTSWSWTITSFLQNEVSPDPGGIPMRFLLKSFVPIGFSLLTLQGISLALRSLICIVGESRDKPFNNNVETPLATEDLPTTQKKGA